MLIAPWIHGGVEATTQLYLFGAVLVAFVLWSVAALAVGRRGMIVPLVGLPVLGGVLLGLVQLIPLGPVSSPSVETPTTKLRAALTAPVPKTHSAQTSTAEPYYIAPHSLAPASTRRDVALLLFALVMLLLGANLFSRQASFRILCQAIAVNGVLLTLFGFFQQATWNGRLYWRFPLPGSATPFGPFVYHNQAASYLAICLAGALGWLWFLSEQAPVRFGGRSRCQPRGSWQSRHLARVAAMLAIGVICAGILGSLSRGIFLATTAGAGVAWLVMPHGARKSSQIITGGIGLCVVLGLLAWLGVSEQVNSRLTSLLHSETLEGETRLPHWRDSLGAVADFWTTGSGLGTYRYVYTQYQDHANQLWFEHAHNQYLEALVDGGVVGLGLLFAAIGLMGLAAWALLKSRNRTAHGFGLLGLFLLVTHVLHAVVDYVMYLPPNMMLFALLCGAIAGSVFRRGQQVSRSQLAGVRLSRWFSWPVAALVLLGAVSSFQEIRRCSRMESTLAKLPWREALKTCSAETLDDAISRLRGALYARPDDAEGREALAEIWLARYRVTARDALLDELAQKQVQVKLDDLWPWTSTVVLHHRAHEHAKQSSESDLVELREQQVVRDCLLPALAQLRESRRHCPLLGSVHVRLGELAFLDRAPGADAMHLARARQMAPSDVSLLYRIGQLDFGAGRYDQAYQAWRRSLSLSDQHQEEIVRLASSRSSAEELIQQLLPDSSERLVAVIQRHFMSEERTRDRDRLLDRAEKLLENERLSEGTQQYLQGWIASARNRPSEAILNYRRAVQLRPEMIPWRFELARLLWQHGAREAAEREARWCVRAKPRMLEYRQFLRQIRTTPLDR